MTARDTRRGFTLLEVVVVMALLLMLAAVILPSIGAFRGDSRQRAAADSIRGEMAVARSRAKDEGRPYKVAFSEDGTRIRRAPEATDFSQVTGADHPTGSAAVVDYAFESVTVALIADGNTPAPTADNGWYTLATIQPDGTCREDTALLTIREDDRGPLYMRLRGLTANVRFVSANTVNGGSK